MSGSEDPHDPKKPRRGAFILATCARQAREEFQARTGLGIISCTQTAYTSVPKGEVDAAELWATRQNWEVDIPAPEPSPAALRYFELVERAKSVKEAKRAAGIRSWDDATDEQRRVFDEEFEKLEAARKEKEKEKEQK